MWGRVKSDQVPDLSQVSGSRSKCTDMVPWLSELKLGRESSYILVKLINRITDRILILKEILGSKTLPLPKFEPKTF